MGNWKYFTLVTAETATDHPNLITAPPGCKGRIQKLVISGHLFTLDGKRFQKSCIYLLSESEAISFLPPKRIWHCTEKEAAETSCWDGTLKCHKTAHTGLGVLRDTGPETPGPPPALGVSPRQTMRDTQPSGHHLKEALIAHVFRRAPVGKQHKRKTKAHSLPHLIWEASSMCQQLTQSSGQAIMKTSTNLQRWVPVHRAPKLL